MKKTLLLAVMLIAAFSFQNLNAQVKGGFKLGVDLSNISSKIGDDSFNDEYDTKRLISPRLGFIIEVPVNDFLFFQSGLFGSVKGFRYEDIRTISSKDYVSKEYEVLICMDLPINFGYKYDLGSLKLFGMAGPVISYNMYATNLYKADGEYDNDHQSIGTSAIDDFKPLNLGVNIEAGVELGSFQFSAFYTQGLSNLSTKTDVISDASIKTSVIGLAAAIKFGRVD